MLPGEGLIFKYKHSVEKTPVIEKYFFTWRGKLVMDETRFQSYGAGLPLETRNFSTSEDYFILKKMNINLDQVRIRVSRTPGQSIQIGDKTYLLQDLAQPGEVIIIRPVSLYQRLF